ncbi:hypothetical protein GIB67_025038 [Kingdonia uniflora]|uniref:NAC domain-containing protein n=1 Tax=Kingdonia uniflora TaxID=39325 RepID=A0A7J7N813_9MAGN|nr:hypothetical protein GIB67_025038 [Kingdonia uniflora]
MENTDSSSGSHPNLPPGFRFHPTDEELIVHYLEKKLKATPLPLTIIAEIELYKFDPWELPGKAIFGDKEWYFFSPRDRKYPNGARPNRASTSGYWKATGTDKPVITSGGKQKIGVKKALVFYRGKPPKGIKTNWIMHEYRLITDQDSTTVNPNPPGNKKKSLRLDDWVLCRIYKKNNTQNDDSNYDIQASRICEQQSVQPQAHKTTNCSSIYGSSDSLYWSSTGNIAPQSSAKRFDENNQNNESSSMDLLLNQLPQGTSYNNSGLLASLGDVFQQTYGISGMNWI